MATVSGYTATRMKVTEDASIVDGEVDGDDLILKRKDGTGLNAGSVRGDIGVDGPPGGIPEAPSDGGHYFRKNETWQQLPLVVEAPVDGKDYYRKDGDWVRVNQPWTLELNESSGGYPTGFSKHFNDIAFTWETLFSGTDYMVAFSFRFTMRHSDFSAAHFVLPTNIRPVDYVNVDAFASYYNADEVAAVLRMRINPNGNVMGPVVQDFAEGFVNIKAEPVSLAGDGLVMQFDPSSTGEFLQVQMSGTYLRSTKDLPSLAVLV
jgi:hypothetical protein